MAQNNDSSLGKLRKHLQEQYRISIKDEESLETIRNFSITNRKVYLYAFALFMLAALLTSLIFSITPLKRLMPGYGKMTTSAEVYALNKHIDSLEYKITAQSVFINNLKRVVYGDVETEEEAKANMDIIPDSVINEQLVLSQEALVDNEAPPEEEISLERSDRKELLVKGLEFFPPLNGSISAGFMNQKGHLGVDILAPRNTAIKSILEGIVISSDWTLETGNTISIQHRDNIISVYKHNSALLKKTGDIVKSGEAIAIIGNSGTLSDGPHLHFELWIEGQPVNPEDYMSFN